MEHILTVGITVEDDAVQRACVEQISSILVNDIRKAILKNTYATGYSASDRLDYALNAVAAEKVERFIECHKEAIIDAAADRAAEKLAKSPKFKEAILNRMEAST